MEVKRVEHSSGHVGSGDSGVQKEIIGFLDETLRPDWDFSISQEYPSIFGEFPGGESFYVRENGRIVSHAALIVREFQHGEHRLKIGMVGSVTTSKDFRGRGMAKAVLSQTIEEMRRRGCILGCLWSGQHEFYRPLGFYRAGQEVDLRFSSDTVPDIQGPGSIEFDPVLHGHKLWRLYQRHDVRVDRSLEEQKRLVKIPRVKIFLTEKEGKITSYIVIHKGADFENYIHEWGGDISEVFRNVAWVQKHRFEGKNLTLIAPSHYELGPLEAAALASWQGVLGLVKVLDRRKLIALYLNYLREIEMPHELTKDETLEMMDEKFDLKDEESLLRVVLGNNTLDTTHPVLPFFLWGLDSI